MPSDFKDLYASMDSTDSKKDKITFHHLSIKYTQGETSEVYRYAVQHLMLKSSGDEAMDAWGRGRKLFPWVAIAAQLPVSLLLSYALYSVYNRIKCHLPLYSEHEY